MSDAWDKENGGAMGWYFIASMDLSKSSISRYLAPEISNVYQRDTFQFWTQVETAAFYE